jgi:hypothetical protein
MNDIYDARLERVEAMLQVVLDALCDLAQEVTGKPMVIGYFQGDHNPFGAGPGAAHIKWGRQQSRCEGSQELVPTVGVADE